MAGGGKETPRQKMINLMYLVLTALLAMNVSKDILKAFVTVNENMERTNTNFDKNTKKVFIAFEDAVKSNPSALPFLEKAKEAAKLINEQYEHIEKLKQKIINETEQNGTDTTRLKFADKKDNYDAPTHLLIGDDETKPSDGEFTAVDLRKRLNGLHDNLVKMLDNMQKNQKTKLIEKDYQTLRDKIEDIKVVDPNETEDGVPLTWEIFNFYHLPLAGVITNLSQMQSDLKNVESEIVAELAGASGKIAIKFNQLSAQVVAPSSYIQAGQKYTADIFIAASSSDFKSENMEIMIGVDSAAAAGGAKGTVVPLVNGVGKYEVGTSGQGDQNFKGVIKFKKPTGEYSYYPFTQDYKVAPPSGTVSADKMNVIYIGVPNPITVSAAGIAPADINATIDGCGGKLTPKGAGKFDVVCSAPGDCKITVLAKTKDGTKAQGTPLIFRVKKIPDPVAKIGGKIVSGPMLLSKNELAAFGGIIAEVPGFDFEARFKVISFTVGATVKGKYQEEKCTGPNLSGSAKSLIASLSSGNKLFLDDIKATGPDGTTRNIPPVSVKVK